MQKLKIQPELHHRGRLFQIPIYFGKMLRSFIYLSDWKMLPMAAVIAALISMVVRKDFFITMEGSIKGAFAITCIAIWNGCFNSIQVICRERPIIKREHRSGMHVLSYVTSHMLYQSLLCLAQSIITIGVCMLVGVQFPATGVITGVGIIDIGISVFLTTYASDMISLFVSSIAHTTTSAMTVMPFILIFQLVFSGGIFTLPEWTKSITQFTVSRYSMQAVCAQADYNELPMVTGWNTLMKVEDREISGTITIGQLLDFADENGVLASSRETILADSAAITEALGEIAYPGATASEVASDAKMMGEIYGVQPEALKALEALEKLAQLTDEHGGLKLGDLIDVLTETRLVQELRDTEIPYNFTVGSLIDSYGREKLETLVKKANATAMLNSDYENSPSHIWDCWLHLMLFAAVFAGLTMISLKFIDKDKR